MSRRIVFVVNPTSQGGALGRRWNALQPRLAGLLDHEVVVEHTRAPRDAERIAREAAQGGAECVVAVGGDGTISEVVSGILGAGLQDAVRVGFVPFGTGGDLARTLDISRDPEVAVGRIGEGHVRRVDAGRLRYLDASGAEATTHFVNIASFGISGLVTKLVNEAPKVLGGRLSFLIGTLRAIGRWRSAPVEIRVDGSPVHTGRLVLAAVANGRFFGGGMQVAPRARADDGLLDIVVVRHMSGLQLVRRLPSIYAGTHLEVEETTALRGAKLEALADPGQVWLDVDGEPLGTLPASFEVLPGALTWAG